MQDLEKRERWLKLVNRIDEQGKIWDPNRNARVLLFCSGHLPNGYLTLENPDPALHVGYTQFNERRESLQNCEHLMSHQLKKNLILQVQQFTNHQGVQNSHHQKTTENESEVVEGSEPKF